MLATVIVFVAAAFLLYWILRGAWLAEFDATLDAKAHALAAMTEQDNDGIKIDLDPGQMPEFGRSEHPDYFVLTDDSSKILAQSQSLKGIDGPLLRSVSPEQLHSFVTLPGNCQGRMVHVHFLPRVEDEEHPPTSQRRATITVARDATHLNEKLLRLAWLLGGVFAVATVMSASAMAWVVSRGLHPLNALADRIQGIGNVDLSERLNRQQYPTEMDIVVERLNEMLEKIEANIRRERAFTADVAHELRTPLAGLTAAMQVCLSYGRSPTEYQSLLRKCLNVSDGMRSMVENLLMLARTDADQVTPAPHSVDLNALVEQEWRAFQNPANDRQLQVMWTLRDHIVIQTDEGLLGALLRNLFDNAVGYCNTGGTVHIEVSRQSNWAMIRVGNTGSLVAAEDAQRVFERFWRGDAARTVSGHSGLGLALCERIARVLGGDIGVVTSLNDQFLVEIRLASGPVECTGGQVHGKSRVAVE